MSDKKKIYKTVRFSATGVSKSPNSPKEPATEKLSKVNTKNLDSPTKPDYNLYRYKSYPNKVNIGIDVNEERYPKEAKVPEYKKYDAQGKYVKPDFIVEKKADKPIKYSIGQLMRDNDSSNPKNKKNNE